MSILVIADRSRGTGHFNLAAGSLATMVGIGVALSKAIGGKLVQRAGYPVSFLTLAAIALPAFALLWLAVPETLTAPGSDRRSTSETEDVATSANALLAQ